MQSIKISFSLIILLLTSILQADELIELDTRPDVTQKFILMKPEKPVASVILFAGGKGALDLQGANSMNWGARNFLVRTRDKFLDNGFMVAVVDAPSDRQEKPWMLFGFRDSNEHVTDIDHVISYHKKQANVPVWLIGTSRGTESAATIAIESKQQPHGLVLTSSMTEENRKGTPVTDMALEKITIPTLITAHESDGCKYTPAEGSEKIKEMLTSAKKVEVKIFTGGDETGKPCKAMSHHGYLDIEDTVVNYIAEFIKSN
jgi:pimeloyl-ACP methyl ester carboxylesterase